MINESSQTRNLHSRRASKELAITEDEINDRMRWNMPVLSSDPKCSISLDLPLKNCHPTSVCAQVCYAAQGRQFYRKSVVKALAIERLIAFDPEHVARKMVDESAGRQIRIAGSDEVLPKHAELLSCVKHLGGDWWGMTRRVDTYQTLPSLMFSTDTATPASVLRYVRDHVPVYRRTYLRRPQDSPSPIEVAVTFPEHGQLTDYANKAPRHATDCPVDRKELEGCWRCKRCNFVVPAESFWSFAFRVFVAAGEFRASRTRMFRYVCLYCSVKPTK